MSLGICIFDEIPVRGFRTDDGGRGAGAGGGLNQGQDT